MSKIMFPFILAFTLWHAVGVAAASEQPKVVCLSTSYGDIVLALDAKKAPRTVGNFLRYARDGHYDGTIFHRVIGHFMIQGGGFTVNYVEKPTRGPIPNEADNGLGNTRGTISMARTSDPHSATSQFFINVVDNEFLDYKASTPKGWGYAVFGRVIKGMDVVDAIRRLPTKPDGPFSKDVPRKPAIITTVTQEKCMTQVTQEK
uniref:Peptidyl-prolyl cis-trans isomerase n=1 Tax=Candidatus Kentrum sp. SD TaxID=2126332 RepID=A0A450YXY1_9GAMM|nr:MAG: peptidyl-prolyl cis-trans isomerase B (cyclophilin B) [Candidatus Kentron sp. SD]VFK46451.1 MAG: peptidyl-prolyl cis-trans isomerase B (cyclophilin B) [Candidatus Kentron sp. SD]VFK79406.1 MAG: peptidyl-prolyl cis-trans isomerase B (cyclophilin B) [Candidatus Kentron sp. SD]